MKNFKDLDFPVESTILSISQSLLMPFTGVTLDLQSYSSSVCGKSLSFRIMAVFSIFDCPSLPQHIRRQESCLVICSG